MGTFLAIIIVGMVCFIASPIVIYFIAKNNPKFAGWVVNILIK